MSAGRKAFDPLQELTAPRWRHRASDREGKSKQYEENVPFATRAATTWPAVPLNVRRAF